MKRAAVVAVFALMASPSAAAPVTATHSSPLPMQGLEDHGNYTVTPKRYILRYTDNTMPETTGYIDRETGEFFNTHGFDNSQTVRLTTTNTGMCSPEVAKPKF